MRTAPGTPAPRPRRGRERGRPARMLPGFGLTLGGTLLFLSLATLLPLSALALKASSLSWPAFWTQISDARALATYRITLVSALAATALNVVLGVSVAWILVRYEFPGRRLLDAAVDLPFALPTAVAGLSLATLLAPNGLVGQLFAPLGIKLAYALPGMVAAMSFTSFPFVARTVQPVLADLDPQLEEAAATLGAGPLAVFRRVVFPAILPATLAGATLALVRCLGEFGAVVFIAGNLPFRTEITSLLIYTRVAEHDYEAAAALAVVILAAALLVLLAMNTIQHRLLRRLH
ncbi:sulfate/thiosulfate transporter subunit [Termitidicoccus mucosus]|uniref:Sulfate transport system permease protein CysT n=2 Tax=Termitidicoccus mucosus TaxID=1184151 RepID=A0A178IMY6_9BACT|nr:sulfate/thiosulfate transporter subunit [Opitutaceae bacterium TSB47]